MVVEATVFPRIEKQRFILVFVGYRGLIFLIAVQCIQYLLNTFLYLTIWLYYFKESRPDLLRRLRHILLFGFESGDSWVLAAHEVAEDQIKDDLFRHI